MELPLLLKQLPLLALIQVEQWQSVMFQLKR